MRHRLLGSIVPEIFETVSTQLRVAHGVLNVPMTEVVLNGACVLPVVGQFESDRVPQHLRMNGHADVGFPASARDNLPKGRGGHRRSALADKDVWCLRVVSVKFA